MTGFFDSGLRLRFCTDVRTRLRRVEAPASSFILVSVVSSKHKLLFHIYLLGLRALFLPFPSFPIGVTVLRVPTICDNWTVVASVPLQGGTVSCFLCLLTGRLMVLFECLDSHLPRVLCQGSPLFWRISSVVGIRLLGQSGLFTSGGDCSSVRLGLPVI